MKWKNLASRKRAISRKHSPVAKVESTTMTSMVAKSASPPAPDMFAATSPPIVNSTAAGANTGVEIAPRYVPVGWTLHFAHPHTRILRNRTNVHCRFSVLADLSQDMGTDWIKRKRRRGRRESPLPPMGIRGMEGPRRFPLAHSDTRILSIGARDSRMLGIARPR